jgi:hypothetical protein
MTIGHLPRSRAGARLALAGVLLSATSARADEVRRTNAERDMPYLIRAREVTTPRRIVAVAAALGPGLVLRGTGSFVVGERRTARRLASLGALGLGVAVIGGLSVGVSGGHPYSLPAVPVLVTGGGLMFTSWWADIAVAAGLAHTGIPRATPPWSVELATLWLHDGYRERGLVRAAGRIAGGRLGAGAAMTVDAERRLHVGELEATVRILGAPPTGAPIASGSRLLVRTALRGLDDADDRVAITTLEVELLGRLDLARFEPTLDGTFIQLSTGIGGERARLAGVTDHNSVLLGTFAWGAYVGRRGEATLFYDHRRDSLAGGLAAWRLAGFVGSFGAALDLLVAPRWAVRGQLELGNAWLTTFGIRYQGGPR